VLRLWLEAIAAERRRRKRHNLSFVGHDYSIPDGLRETLRGCIDLGWLIGQDTDLDRSGSTLRGACPLHGGDNPTELSVTPERGLWYCHACGQGGDVYRWVMLYQGVDYVAAVRWLCALAGMPIPEREERKRQRKRKKPTIHVEGGKVVAR
jgi:DNA primase